MCGFAALIATQSRHVDPQQVARMGDAIVHRGPDDSGLWCEGAVGLAFRRLAILDLSPAGHQPMCSEDGRYVLVFNGEIYNYRELRSELETMGHRFRSSGDTEVLLTAYMQWGRECVRRLNGMWAFLIYDQTTGVVFGSRDHFGIKPLYVGEYPGGLAYASEIKALLTLGIGRSPDWSRVSEWLASGTLDLVPSRGRTFYEGIREVPPATAFELHLDGQARQWTYWSLDAIERRPRPDASEEYAALFEDAVRLQARADVPLAVSLSGGLDSTAIACALARQTGTQLEAFTYNSDDHDESRYVRATLEWTGATRHLVEVTPTQLFDTLPQLLAMHDEPVHTFAAAISWHIMGAARARGIKVVMSGQGADEALAGYSTYFLDYWAQLVHDGQSDKAFREIDAYTAMHGGDAALRRTTSVRRASRLRWHRVLPLYSKVANALQQRRLRRGAAWYLPEVMAHLPPVSSHTEVGLTAALRASIAQAPLPMYLRLDDRNSMAHGVEARVPFLDSRLVELAFSVPEYELLSGPWNKWLLRRAMRDRAPSVVRDRVDKMGFAHPYRSWFRETLADRVIASLHDHPEVATLVDIPAVVADAARHRRGEIDVGLQLFRVAQLGMWLRQLSRVAPNPATPSVECTAA
ncbi:MAG: asparagine synthase (glutamine-hydrolyzing) [Gemmatimonas sp.]|nr:asparagine synthase (glutamine-hydrolyzing) [Gemmatimonadota bacterium]